MRAAMLILLAGPALAQDALTPEEQAALQGALAAPAPPTPSANPHIALILDVAAAGFTDDAAPTGAHDPRENGFNFQQLELNLRHAVDPFFELQASLVFVTGGVEVEEAFATTLALPAGLQVRAGQFLTRMGRLNPTHPHAWAFVDQPLVVGRFLGAEGAGGVGVEGSWLSPLPWYVMLYASTTQAVGAHAHGDEEATDHEDHGPEPVHTARLEQFFPFDDAWSLTWGLNTQVTPEDHGRLEVHSSDLYLRWRPTDATGRTAFSIQIEGFYRADVHDGDRHAELGTYGQAVLDFASAWQVGGRYEWVQGEDPAEVVWSNDRQRVSAQTTFFPSHFSRLRLQYSFDDRPDARVHGVMLALEALIGAHGAHGF